MQAEKAKESKRSSATTWQSRIDTANKAFEKWHKQSEQIIKRYRDERDTLGSKKRRFNILWSNVQVLTPALYGRPAKPEVSRRFNDQDQVGRVASMILERGLDYEVEQYPDFNQAMRGGVEDRLLPGRGSAWVRYEPHITTEPQVSNNVDAQKERLDYECAPVDYVNWRDFLHSPARTWDEVWWVARCVWMTKEEGEERFGDIFADIPLEYESNTKTGTAEELPKEAMEKKAKVWEIWDKNDREAIWIAEGFSFELDRKPDPLEVEGFYPCPKPLFATTTTGSLIPVPDYSEYLDQAEELDTYTQRIHLLSRALKVVGVYNGEYKQLQRLLNEGVDNTMIGVDSWAAMAEKGGLKGAVEFLPVQEVAEVLKTLVELRQVVLTDIWQIMGLSDIMRGSTDAQETLGAQEMKAQFGSMRLKTVQEDVARYASDILRLKAQVMCKKFNPQTLLAISGIQYTQDGQDEKLVQAALALLKEGQMSAFRIKIESDSLAQIDESKEKQEAAEFIKAMGAILKEAVPVVQAAPPMMSFVGELMMFAARRMRVGRSVEQSLEQSLAATQQQLSEPKGIPPEAQEQMQAAQQELAKKGQELQGQEQELFRSSTQQQVEKIQFDADKKVFASEVKMAQERLGLNEEKAKLGIDRETDKLKQAANDAQREGKEVEAKKTDSAEIEARNERMSQMAEAVLQGNMQLAKSLESLGKTLPQMAAAVAAVAEAAGADKELVVDKATGRKRVVRVMS